MVRFADLRYVNTTEENSLSFIVAGEPAVQQRPKIAYRYRTIPVYYDPSSTEKKNWKKLFIKFLKDNNVETPVFGSNPLMDSGITLKIHFYLSRPENDFLKKKNGTKTRKSVYHHYPSMKDIDNMIKFYMDAMQEVAYKNDHVICELVSSKKFLDDSSTFPFTQVLIQQTMLTE